MKRIVWIDYAKVIGLYLVILAHLYTSEGIDKSNVIRTFIYGFHMPFFFFISGILFKERNGGIKSALSRNVKSLLWPFLSLNLLFSIIYGIQNGNWVENILNIPVNVFWGNGNCCKASWFVICLFNIKCIYDLLYYKRLLKWGFLLILFLTFLPIRPHYFYYASTIFGFVFYHIGNICKKYIKANFCSPKWLLLIALALFLGSYYLTLLNGKVSMYKGFPGNNIFFFYLNALVGSFGILCISFCFKDKQNDLITKASIASIGVVLLHMFFVDLFKNYKFFFHSSVLLFLYYCISSFVIYFICTWLFHISNKYIPIVWGKK